MNGLDVAAAARAYLGAPWVHQGRSRAGVDCLGLVACVARDVGADVGVDEREYAVRPDFARLAREFRARLRDVRRADPEPGDVLLFRDSRYPGHLGIMATDGRFVHALRMHGPGRVVEVTLAGPWRERLVLVGGLPGIERAASGSGRAA
jgi:cell wall-associated NlpC family hydrolase